MLQLSEFMTVVNYMAVRLLSTLHTGWPKNWHHFLYALTLPNINRFSKLFYYQNQKKIRNNTITKDPTTPKVYRYTTLL